MYEDGFFIFASRIEESDSGSISRRGMAAMPHTLLLRRINIAKL
jgi:hypothetical protein